MNANLNPKSVKSPVHFEISFNTMDDGSARSICKGDILSTTELPKRNWISKFKKGGVFVIFDSKHGIIIREVVNYSSDTNEIKCRTWSDNEKYPNINLKLESIVRIYTIDTISRNLEKHPLKRA